MIKRNASKKGKKEIYYFLLCIISILVISLATSLNQKLNYKEELENSDTNEIGIYNFMV